MTRREIATFVTGALLGAAVLVPMSTVAQDSGAQKKPAAPATQEACDGGQSGCTDAAPAKAPAAPAVMSDCGGCDMAPVAPAKAPAAPAGMDDCGDCGGCDEAPPAPTKAAKAPAAMDDCGDCGGCDEAPAAPTKAAKAPAAMGDCGGCDMAPTPVKDEVPAAPAAPATKADDCDDCGGCEGEAKTKDGAGCVGEAAKGDCGGCEDMDAWMAAGTPGESHRKLSSMVGTWNAKQSFWMEPGAAPLETTAVSVNTWDLGGRFVEQRFYGSLPGTGQAFEGHGFTGFDNVSGKFVGLWMDSFTTGFMTTEGAVSPCGKVLTFRGEQKAPAGAVVKYRFEMRLESADRHVFVMWQAMGDAPEAKVMETVYTRRS